MKSVNDKQLPEAKTLPNEIEIPVIIVKQQAVVERDFSKIKKDLDVVTDWYNSLIVGKSDVSDAKKKATSLNKVVTELKKKKKEVLLTAEGSIKDFVIEMDSIISQVSSTRQNLLSQVRKFDEETLKLISNLLIEELKSLYILYKVDEEFQEVKTSDLVLLGNLTKVGQKLTNKTVDVLTERVLFCKETQDKVILRLTELSGKCLEAGLEAPLQKHNVRHFLFSDDYDVQLKKLIEQELYRQEQTKQRIAEQLKEKEARAKQISANQQVQKNSTSEQELMDSQKAEIEKINHSNHAKTEPKVNAQYNSPANSNTYQEESFRITVTMEISKKDLKSACTAEQLKIATERRFQKCGFKSIKSVSVQSVKPLKGLTSKNQTSNGIQLAPGSSF